jgi:CBS domain-containing protein
VLTRVVARGLDPDTTTLATVMTPDPDTVGPDDLALEVLERLRASGYRHLPVVDDGKVVGIVSIRDLYAAAKRELEEDLQQREAFIFDTGYGTG